MCLHAEADRELSPTIPSGHRKASILSHSTDRNRIALVRFACSPLLESTSRLCELPNRSCRLFGVATAYFRSSLDAIPYVIPLLLRHVGRLASRWICS